MLIINADDFGRTVQATDNSLACFRQGLITSASAMVFMGDSLRASELAIAAGLETGLHLNLTLPFSAKNLPPQVREKHRTIMKYLSSGTWASLVYNPLISRNVEYIFKTQWDEYNRLFFRRPARIDGHHHMHLCMNMVLDRIIPFGLWVRRNFSFRYGEKNAMNRLYRRAVDAWLCKHYRCTDFFFSIDSGYDRPRHAQMIRMSASAHMELMVHPEKTESYEYLSSTFFRKLLETTLMGTFGLLSKSSDMSHPNA